MTFQDFIEKLIDHYPEAVVPFLRNRRRGGRTWTNYTKAEYRDWHEWVSWAFDWGSSPERFAYWDRIAENEPKEEVDLRAQCDAMIEALQNLKKKI